MTTDTNRAVPRLEIAQDSAATDSKEGLYKKIGPALARQAIYKAVYVGHIANALSQPARHPLTAINRQHGFSNLYGMEGYVQKAQMQYFTELLTSNPDIKEIAEIGFNGGYSSFLFLGVRPDIKVTSFDIGEHSYVKPAAEFINRQFNGRHELHLGDSKLSVPQFSEANPDKKFDLIFIDGGHDLQTAATDLANMAAHAHAYTIVIMDDYMPYESFGAGPYDAWNSGVRNGLVFQEAVQSGSSSAWAEGKYIK